MRLFTAFGFPSEVSAELARAQAGLRRVMGARRWQAMADAHLTLHFLGETPEPLVAPLQAALAAACRETPPFTLALGEWGGFPSLERPRVLWLGVGGERARLEAFEARLRPTLAGLGLAVEDRAYRPHITLAREPDARAGEAAWRAAVAVRPLSWCASELLLVRSALHAEGARHTVVGRYPLGGG